MVKQNHSLKNIFINSAATTLLIILLLVVFEIAFYFIEIKPTLENVLDTTIQSTSSTLDIKTIISKLCQKLFPAIKEEQELCADIIANDPLYLELENSWNDYNDTMLKKLRKANKSDIKRNSKIGTIVMTSLVIALISLTTFVFLYFKKEINYRKTFQIVGISYGVIMLLEVLLFLFVYRKLQNTDTVESIDTMLTYIGNNLPTTK